MRRVVLLFTLLVAGHLSAQYLPGSREINSLSIDRNGTVLVATSGAGLFRSDDRGRTWTHVSGLPDRVACVTHDRSAAGVAYAGAIDGVYRSSDSGKTWKRISDKGYIVDIAARGPQIYVAAVSEVLASRDGGKTWRSKGEFLKSGAMAVAIHPKSANVAYAIYGEESPARGVIKTVNGGETWQTIKPEALLDRILAAEDIYVLGNDGTFVIDRTGSLQPLGTIGSSSATAMTADVGDPRHLFLATFGSLGKPSVLYESRDAGKTWTEVQPVRNFIRAIAASPDAVFFADGDRMFVRYGSSGFSRNGEAVTEAIRGASK